MGRREVKKSSAISIYEVSPRDGLQSLSKVVPLRKKVKLVRKLKRAGLDKIEVGSLVHPSMLPMRDSDKLYKKTGGDLLVMNKKGFERAKNLGVKHINVVISPCEKFIEKNQKTTYTDAIRTYENISKEIPINRLYISCCFSEDTSEESVLECVEWGKNIAKTVILCDTDSTATKESVHSLCSKALQITPNLGIHLHMSNCTIDCVKSAYDAGIRKYDSSIGGLGGCFSVKDAKGNIPTEILVMWALCNSVPITQDIRMDKLFGISKYAVKLEYTNTERFSKWVGKKIGMLV